MYDKIARYYDLTHADLTADIDYILTLVGETAVSIIEFGCGSGRLLLPLARAGHSVTGIDNSVVMLTRAQERMAVESEEVRQRLTLVEADMTQMNLAPDSCEWAIMPYNTFMHLEPDQMSGVLKKIAHGMNENGRLFIDLINPTAILSTPNDHLLTLEGTFIDPENEAIVVQQSSSLLDEETQTLTITWLYDASPLTGGPVQRLVAQAAYHYLYVHQLELLLHESGLVLYGISGGYDDLAYSEESERLLIVARKR